jgi:sensor histidine kinase regulating citrate/malate metabolism
MCTYGYSTKGEKRGIGLARVRELCVKAGASLMLENIKKDNLNWVNISIVAPKQKR